MIKYIMDKATAWAELARFAEVAGIELDERAHPDYEPVDDDTKKEAEAEEESEVSDYDEVIRALRTGHLAVSEGALLFVNWERPPHDTHCMMTLDPEDWNYSRATRALHTVPVAPTVSKAARKRMGTVQEDDRLGRMDRFLEILGNEEPGTMLSLKHRLDRELVTMLTKFILLE